MTRAINATNQVIIGEPVYSKLSVKEGFTDRLEYIITDCIASLTEEPTELDPKFPIIQVSTMSCLKYIRHLIFHFIVLVFSDLCD